MGNKQRIGKHTNGQKVHEKGVNIDDPQNLNQVTVCDYCILLRGVIKNSRDKSGNKDSVHTGPCAFMVGMW